MCDQTSRIESRRCVGRLLSERAHVRQAMNRGPLGQRPAALDHSSTVVTQMVFCATTCASCLLESNGQMHSAPGLSIIYVHSRPKSLQLARTRQAVQAGPCNLAVLVLHPGSPARKGAAISGGQVMQPPKMQHLH